MLRTWLEPKQISVPEDYIQAIGGNPLVSQVLYWRGITDVESARSFLSPENFHPTSPTELPGLQPAVDLLEQAIFAKKRIGVWGDFDVDGQTSTTVFVSALQQLGGNVVYHIPVRAEESHGISLPALQKFMNHGVDIVLTCDTGISSHEAIAYAQRSQVPVIITDHHDLPEELPAAAAIVNPKLLPIHHPLAYLPGVGVAYKIVERLFEQSRKPELTKEYLDLVALGIVVDIALLTGENRYLLQLGLHALRQSRRVGLLAIMELAELNQVNLTEEHISYILAPRMNALGRLDDANSMVELLTTTDKGRARLLALELEGMNAQRTLLSDQVFQAAQAQITTDPRLLDFPVLVLSHPGWPAGVVGIVASRLVEQYHRPVILLATPSGQDGRGSARSIEGINITSAIAANQNLVKSFGGHPMAAGLAMDPAYITNFRLAISRTVQAMGIEVQQEKDLQVDGYLGLPELSLELVEDLERLAPFGAGNPPLVFATRNLRLTGYVAVGRTAEHLQITLEDELGHTQRSIWWQGAGYPLPDGKFDLAYSMRTSTYRGQREIQLEWIDYRPLDTQSISTSGKKSALEVVDMRSEPDALAKLNELLLREAVLVWGEADAKTQIPCLDRSSLYPTQYFAIWTIPPGLNELQSALNVVNPNKVFLFASNPGMDEPEKFLRQLLGLMKNCLKSHQGMAHLSNLAAATAQRIQTVKVGLEWLDEHGYIRLLLVNENEVKIEKGSGRKTGEVNHTSARLDALLAESAAFRRYYQSAHADRLVTIDE